MATIGKNNQCTSIRSPGGQCYKLFVLVKDDSRVVVTSKLLIFAQKLYTRKL